jgi:hypothetical protein
MQCISILPHDWRRIIESNRLVLHVALNKGGSNITGVVETSQTLIVVISRIVVATGQDHHMLRAPLYHRPSRAPHAPGFTTSRRTYWRALAQSSLSGAGTKTLNSAHMACLRPWGGAEIVLSSLRHLAQRSWRRCGSGEGHQLHSLLGKVSRQFQYRSIHTRLSPEPFYYHCRPSSPLLMTIIATTIQKLLSCGD